MRLDFLKAFAAAAILLAGTQAKAAPSDDRFWTKLQDAAPTLAPRLRQLHSTYCSIRQTRKEGAPVDSIEIPGLNLRHLAAESSGYFAVLESEDDMQRVLLHDFDSHAKIELHDVRHPRNWKRVDLSITTEDCSPLYFSYTEQGAKQVTSFSSQNRFHEWKTGKLPDSALNPRPVIVAVIDAGFNLRHPLLAPYLARDASGAAIALNARDFVESLEPDEHGNHVAGIVSREEAGIAVIAVQRPDDNYLGQGPSQHRFIAPTPLLRSASEQLRERQVEAVEFAVRNGARVVNMSFGGTYRTRPSYAAARANPESFGGFEDAIYRFDETAFVLAAGNDGKNIDDGLFHPASERRPNAAVVAAVDAQGKLANFSNYGKAVVDFAAPGVDIESLDAGTEDGQWRSDLTQSGTSMAAPYVSRVIAKMLSIRPDLSPEDAISILCLNVTRTWELLQKTRCGGYITESKALAALGY